MVLACAVVLDPRYKLDFVDYIFKKIESNDLTAKTKLQHVRTQLYQLFSEYEHQKPMVAENVSSCVGSSSHSSAPSGVDHEEDMEVDVSNSFLMIKVGMLCFILLILICFE